MACIDAGVAYLLEMFFGDMFYEAVYEIKYGDGFHDQLLILVALIVDGDCITIIAVNA